MTRFGKDPLLQVRIQTSVGQDFYVSAEKLLNILLEGDDVKQRGQASTSNSTSLFSLIVTAHNRAQHPHVTHR